jgi:glycosyltransferase involved in cell wall biosynthesis
MDQLDLFVLPSRYEAGPYAPLEAMRAGVAVVLTDVVGNRDAVVDGESGVLVPPDDPETLAGAITRLLADDGLRRRLAEAGERRVRDRFDVRAQAERTLALYRELARG